MTYEIGVKIRERFLFYYGELSFYCELYQEMIGAFVDCECFVKLFNVSLFKSYFLSQ